MTPFKRWQWGVRPTDVERDRRLSPEEEAAIRLSLSGTKRPDRERALDRDDHFTALFDVILGTGMRLREAYRLRVGKWTLLAELCARRCPKLGADASSIGTSHCTRGFTVCWSVTWRRDLLQPLMTWYLIFGTALPKT